MWHNLVIQQLQANYLFEDAAHLSRFRELTDCYYQEPFFTPGLVKCMFLSAWDDEHFSQILDIINQMKFGTDMGLDDMKENGEYLAEESTEHRYDAYVIQLSCCFIENSHFDLTALPDDLEPEGIHIITQAVKCSAVIDSIPFHS